MSPVLALEVKLIGQKLLPFIPSKVRSAKSSYVSTPIKPGTKQGNAKGASEIRRCTASIHFHCPAPRSSSHIGHVKMLMVLCVLARERERERKRKREGRKREEERGRRPTRAERGERKDMTACVRCPA